MISVAVWITSDEARIFAFRTTGVQTKNLHRHGKHEGDPNRFLHEVAEELIHLGPSRWLLVGPGLAKAHFKSHVESHHAAYADRIAGLEALDKSTDGQIKDFAHEFFKHKAVFEKVGS